MVEATGECLVFVLSTPRAGSTLLGAILGNHSRVFCPNEPWLLVALQGLTQEKTTALASSNENLAAIALRDLLSPEEFIDASRAFALTVYNQKLRQARKEIFVDKTPRYSLLLPFLDQMFPASKKIWLQRNPLDVALSFAAAWDVPIAELTGETLSINSFDLTVGLHNYVNYFQGQPNTLEIRYEDLVMNPTEHVASLCEYLQIEPEDGMEQYGSDGPLAERKQQMMGDKKIFSHSSPHASSINRWKEGLAPADVQRLIDVIGRDPFERMGYDETIRDVERLGLRFPSDSKLEARLRRLRRKARRPVYKPPPPDPLPAPPTAIPWWLKLGKSLGVAR